VKVVCTIKEKGRQVKLTGGAGMVGGEGAKTGKAFEAISLERHSNCDRGDENKSIAKRQRQNQN